MKAATLDTSALDALRSSEQQTLLDEIDNLRLQGISEFVFLPQIVVCGDQSSGKSSVLEAISRVPFPRNDTLCTRFATEVILRQAEAESVAVSIQPSEDASEAECTRLRAFKQSLPGLSEFPRLIENAKKEMGISSGERAFSKNVLRVEISGPDKPKLTVVDLPGLIHSNSKQQSATDVELISDLVRSYMINPRSIVLAVISAKNDYANQIILKRAKEVDVDGLRTLGLITKPDTLYPGSDSEAEYLELARNDNIQFRLGWHVVRNRDYDERNTTAKERDDSESQFFSSGTWGKLPSQLVGVGSLRQRLSDILLDQIKQYLPDLLEDIQKHIKDCKSKLSDLGDSRETPDKQRQFLLKISESFQTLCRAAVDGRYEDAFFGDPIKDEEYCKRVRAVVVNVNMGFSKLMHAKGHRRRILEDVVDEVLEDGIERPTRHVRVHRHQTASPHSTKPAIFIPLPPSTEPAIPEPLVMSRTDAIDWVRNLLVRSRGRELPGSFNPLLVGELFRDQSMYWDQIACHHVKDIWTKSKDFIESLFDSILDKRTSRNLFTHWVDPNTTRRLERANEALNCILADRERHPITCNHYYTETLKGFREDRWAKELERKLKRYPGLSGGYSHHIDLAALAKELSTHSEEGMDTVACSELLDSMQAYYKVALKTFVDNITAQVVERVLIGDLWSIFSPSDVGQMSPELITKIAAESTESQAQRQQLERKLDTLKQGLETCRQHSTHAAKGSS